MTRWLVWRPFAGIWEAVLAYDLVDHPEARWFDTWREAYDYALSMARARLSG